MMVAAPERRTWTWPAARDALSRARHAALEFADQCGVPEEVTRAVALATTEAVTNAVVHAYREGRRGAVSVEATCDERRLVVTVRDEGGGLRPRIDSPGLGLGLGLIAQVADETDIRTPPSGGTEVVMTFRLAG
ncbi:ATP-binding protein [Conexibacter sp. SYSU D00693]|uniref:ATP-binding protein n=1 Tax=Conexibacter sp. SYSU D00693 TaxID=2812560 RepID=UPI00196AEAA8|nr:ATP-binding protein [Conexibacter sp. SYSU D00693]